MPPMALLIMDVQQGIVERFPGDDSYLDRLATAIAAARSAGVAVIYVTVAFRPGYPEVSEHNKTFSAIAGTGRFTDGDPGMRIPPAIAPAPGEVTVTKRRVSAFSGSDLEVVLRARGISHLVLDRASVGAPRACLDAT
jgi:nicotinamidase-related amidase